MPELKEEESISNNSNNNANNASGNVKKWIPKYVVNDKHNTEEGYESKMLDVIKSFFDAQTLNESKIDSFNKTINDVPEMIKNSSPFHVSLDDEHHVISIDNICINKSTITETDGSTHEQYPKEARLRKESYYATIHVTINYAVIELKTESKNTKEIIELGRRLKKIKHMAQEAHVVYDELPVLVGSELCHLNNNPNFNGECPSDIGGYFINDGNEKMLMYCERTSYNKSLCFTEKGGPFGHYVQYRSDCPGKYISSKNVDVQVYRATKTNLESLYIQEIPWVTYIRALGIERDKDIYTWVRFIFGDRWNKHHEKIMTTTLENNQGILTTEAAQAIIGKLTTEKSLDKMSAAGLTYLKERFLPNHGLLKGDFINKIITLILMAREAIDYFYDSKLKTSKDSYFYKETENCEDLVGLKIRELIKVSTDQVKGEMIKALRSGKSLVLKDLFSKRRIGKRLKEMISTGTWHVDKSKVTKTGVCQKMDRANDVSTKSQQTKNINQLRKDLKQSEPRMLSTTGFGLICVADSPEGEACGLVKYNAILQHFSIGTSGDAIITLLYRNIKNPKPGTLQMKYPVIPFDELSIKGIRQDVNNMIDSSDAKRQDQQQAPYAVVKLNGVPIGIHRDVLEVVHFLNYCKRTLHISSDTGISFDQYGVDIRTGRGRSLRPLVVQDNVYKLREMFAANSGKPCGDYGSLDWYNLLAEGVIEYVDKEQELNLVIAESFTDFIKRNTQLNSQNGRVELIAEPLYNYSTLKAVRYTHIELHGVAMFGVTAATVIPFPDHNQSPRNTYECSMAKQAQGAGLSNTKTDRMDQSSVEMWYAERPLVETSISKILNCHKFPYGQNLMLAIVSTGGKNQEDASLSSQAPLDFGMMRSVIRRTQTVSEKRQVGARSEYAEEFKKYPKHKLLGKKKGNYDYIEADGLPAVASPVEPGTILAQKTVKLKEPIKIGEGNDHIEYKDMSVAGLSNTLGRIDKVAITSTACGKRTASIRIRKVSTVVTGDKFATRFGQKGITNVTRTSDLMYTESGIIPHWILNCLAFTSRMTWGEFLETLLAMISLATGCFGDATPYSKRYRDTFYKAMEKRRVRFETQETHIVDELCNAAIELGLPYAGEHVMYDGRTGQRLKTLIFCGYTFVHKLKHMVKEKYRARQRGRAQAQTRQAIAGRTLGGGLKFSDMERDCLAGHGASHNIQDRTCLSADLTYNYICKFCGNKAICNEAESQAFCNVCNRLNEDIVRVAIPQTTNLMCNEMTAANIAIHFDVVEK